MSELDVEELLEEVVSEFEEGEKVAKEKKEKSSKQEKKAVEPQTDEAVGMGGALDVSALLEGGPKEETAVKTKEPKSREPHGVTAKKKEKTEKITETVLPVKIEKQAKPPVVSVQAEAASLPAVTVEDEVTGEQFHFEFEEESGPYPKEVYMIFGDKGEGKTTLAMSFPGQVVVLSFDRKAAIIKFSMYDNDPRIHVFDVMKYMDYSSPEAIVRTGEKTFLFINALLDYVAEKIKPDWIVIDGAEIFQQVCEWTMRHRRGLTATQGVQIGYWKERKYYIRQIHNKALTVAKRGVIYTTYTTFDETIIEGTTVTRKEVPRWIDIIKFETDYVLRTIRDPTDGTFKVKIVSSKNDKKLPTGLIVDVTGRNFWEALEEAIAA